MPACIRPTPVECGPALTLYRSADPTLHRLNRARFIRYVGTLARQGGPPCDELAVRAAACALQVRVRVWAITCAQKPAHVLAQYAPLTERRAPVVDVLATSPPSLNRLHLFDPITATAKNVGDDGESLYACLAYALNLDNVRAHRAAFDALCTTHGPNYMSFINEFLPPRTPCIAKLRQRVAEELRVTGRYEAFLDRAMANFHTEDLAVPEAF